MSGISADPFGEYSSLFSGLDLQKLKMDQEALAQRSASYAKMWSPVVGANIIRILPPWKAGLQFYYKTVGYHFNIKEYPIVCPLVTANLSCPICALVEHLHKTKDEQLMKIAKEYSVTIRTAFNLIDYTKDSYSQQVWPFACPTSAANVILRYINDPQCGGLGLLHPISGHNWIFTKPGGTIVGSYPAPQLIIQPTPLNPSAETVKLIMQNLWDLDTVFTPPTHEELKEIMTKLVEPLKKASQAVGSSPQVSPQTVPQSSVSTPPVQASSSVAPTVTSAAPQQSASFQAPQVLPTVMPGTPQLNVGIGKQPMVSSPSPEPSVEQVQFPPEVNALIAEMEAQIQGIT